jgi:2-succinyl-6-hydroxy-2,4-cyclohexadiene-1-carboxylate synthase
MGARLALHAALQPSHRLTGLVLIGAHPGIADEEEKRLRRESDHGLAARIEQIGIEAFLDEWLQQPMFENVRDLDNRDRLSNSADGLAYALRTLGTGNQRLLDAELPQLEMPVLVITGDRDVKFTELTERFRFRLKNATIATIPNAGHACHLEQPEATRETIEGWLENLRNGDSHRQ